ncbi:hypothetical protein Pan216_27410 [Planctomycetes bacterium Pan216]|uniref:Uncharacterized protein n=1 Tax=Kolteria novifilia TaxID=2527975 RepID=A0A518B4L7_9BACT|nr:hypothetical protein Pan216_27410 [Planctomycetes bacterium Pan216]
MFKSSETLVRSRVLPGYTSPVRAFYEDLDH